jgi:hypothetical protein
MAVRSPALALRQHHGIEHATIAVLTRRCPGIQLVARSDLGGFIVLGEVETTTLAAAAREALARLQGGEKDLAVHPNCGTNLVTAGILSGAAALAAGSGRNRSNWDRLPAAILGATLALIAALPLGRWAQKHLTTSGEVAGLRIADVMLLPGGPVTRHRVTIEPQWNEN